jgi:hypothetical protein
MIRIVRFWSRMIALAGCLIAGALLTPPLRGEPLLVDEVPVTETTVCFCDIFKALRLTPLQSMKQLGLAPERTLLVVCGDTSVLKQVPGTLSGFLEQGGAVLVATDQNSSGHTDELGVAVRGTAVRAEGTDCYRDQAFCPLVTEFEDGHPIFKIKKIGRIASNRPSYLATLQAAHVLAWFSPNCTEVDATHFWQEKRGFGDPGFRKHGRRSNDRLAFAAVPKGMAGRVLVLADHSIFIDEMMLQRDNDNFDFAFNCVQWLTAPDGRRSPRRDRILFVYNGEIITDFGPPLPELPDPPIPPINVVGDRILTELESKNIFNRLLLDQVPLERVLQVLFIALSMGLAAYGLIRLRRARHRPEPALLLPTRSLSVRGSPPSVVEQRHQELIADGNVWEAARALARQFFESVLGFRPTGTGTPPRMVLSGDGRRDRSLAEHVRRLWQLAYDAAPTRVSPRQLEDLIAQLEALRAALSNGTLRLEQAGVS